MISDYSADICNCPECSYFDMDKAHCCGLPERITQRDVPRIKDTIQSCLCVNPRSGGIMSVWRWSHDR